MKVILAGSRKGTEMHLLEQANLASGFEITEVVCGDARGVDTLGREWATQYKIPMAVFADALIAVWDDTSRGAKHRIEIAQAKGLAVQALFTKKDK